MRAKTKTILGIIAFIVFIGLAYSAYYFLSKEFKPTGDLQHTDSISQALPEKIPAPDFTVLDNEGNEVKLSDFIGKPIVLNFWASWCPPCKDEMPYFDSVYADLKDDVVFLMLDMVDGKRETVEKGKQHIADNGYSFPVYFDVDQEVAAVYGVSSLPSTLFIDKDGNIVTGYRGAIDEEVLLKTIEMIL